MVATPLRMKKIPPKQVIVFSEKFLARILPPSAARRQQMIYASVDPKKTSQKEKEALSATVDIYEESPHSPRKV